MTKERSGAVQRRRALAAARREITPDYFEREIRTRQEAEERLQKNREILGQEDNLTSKENVSLTIENIWLKFKLDRLSQAERQSQLQKFLNDLEGKAPDIYNWLTSAEFTNWVSPLVRIRDRVIPPKTIEGYYTKRG